jgi:hypothetical protein
MQLMGLDDSGKCPICMATVLLEYIMFYCNYSAAVHKRQDWTSGIKVMLQRHHRQPQTENWRQDDARVEVNLELQDIFMRHPYKQFLWRGLWPTFLREHLTDRMQGKTAGRRWAKDAYRKILAWAVLLFSRLAFAAVQEIQGIRYRVTLKINAHLNQLSLESIQHIPRIPHAGKNKLPKGLAIPAEEVHLLIQRKVRKAPGTTSQIRGKVLIQAQHTRGMYSMVQLETRWSGFLVLPMEGKRHRANQAREALCRQIIP